MGVSSAVIQVMRLCWIDSASRLAWLISSCLALNSGEIASSFSLVEEFKLSSHSSSDLKRF